MRTIFWNVKDAFMGQKLIVNFAPLIGGLSAVVFGGYHGLQNLTTPNIYYDEEFSSASDHAK